MFGNFRSVVIGLVFLSVFGLTFGASEQASKVDPLANASVLVEAFVVEVELDALKEAGVSIVGMSPESVSVLKILWCLRDKEMGAVVSGAKVCVKNREEGEVSDSETVYVKTEMKSQNGRATNTRYDSHQAGKSFSVNAYLESDTVIGIEYNYSETGFDEEKDEMGPPATFNFELKGTLTAKSGKPLVAGAVQNDESVKFLIVCATVQSEIDSQKRGRKKKQSR
ncbi:MAG: hypothetical protein FVQ79_12015 [Planctomycetes bacterium]|nr:hypothetical protein [Planctomycetota bacterium]